jgi:hypothetical protein
MSVLADITSHAEAAHSAFDEARSLAKQATEAADDLEQSAAGHGWDGVAQAMTSAKESLEAAESAIDGALESTSAGLQALGEITDTMSSDEVARRLGEIGHGFEEARGSAEQALQSLDDASTAAAQADAETVLQTLNEADGKLREGRESLDRSVSDAQAEQSEATGWGS